uniref:Uncharacterized protein n=1 Tax=Arundo donax TaxID=35708 RepID=A0A0A9H7G6_ARUDO
MEEKNSQEQNRMQFIHRYVWRWTLYENCTVQSEFQI